jgi:hypothetical protein
MRPWFSLTLLFALCLAFPFAAAQEDQPSLGDLARTLRKSKAEQTQERPVIDNENLVQAMEDVKKLKPENRLVFSLDQQGNGFKVSSPDVTCSLSFNARAASLLIKPVLVEDVPIGELLKLDGPASIQDDTLQLEVDNNTEWELREITVGLTLERKPGENAELAASARVIPAAGGFVPPTLEKHSDVTVLYHLKGTAKPFSKTAFRENIGITPGPDQDWRWSIVEAKGIRPANSPAPEHPVADQADETATKQPLPDSPPAAAPPTNTAPPANSAMPASKQVAPTNATPDPGKSSASNPQ